MIPPRERLTIEVVRYNDMEKVTFTNDTMSTKIFLNYEYIS